MKPLHLCLSASLILALSLITARSNADDAEKGKKKTIRAVVVADGDGQSRKIQIEAGSLEEVHRRLAEKLKDLPADLRKKIEAGLKQAKAQHHGEAGQRRIIVKRSESKSTSETKKPQVRVEAHAFRIDADGKATRVEAPKQIRVRVANKDGEVTELTKDLNLEVEVEVEGDAPKVERRLRIRKANEGSAHPAHGGEKKIERRIIIGKVDSAHSDHKHGDHKKHEHGNVKKSQHRVVIGDTQLKGLPKELQAQIQAKLHEALKSVGGDGEAKAKTFQHRIVIGDGQLKGLSKDLQSQIQAKLHEALKSIGHGDHKHGDHKHHAHGDHKHEHGDHKHGEKKIERRIILGGGDLQGLPKEIQAKIHAALKKIGHGDAHHAHGDHKHEHGDHKHSEKKIERRIVIGATDLQGIKGLPKEMQAKIRAAVEKAGHGDAHKHGSPRVIIMRQDGKQGLIELNNGVKWQVQGDAEAIRKKLQAHGVEVKKAPARKSTAIKVAEAKKATAARVQQGSSVTKRLDKIERELKVIRELLESIRKRD